MSMLRRLIWHVQPEHQLNTANQPPKNMTITEASYCSPEIRAHDTFRRLLLRLEASSDTLWEEVKDLVEPQQGVLIVDDCSGPQKLDTPLS